MDLTGYNECNKTRSDCYDSKFKSPGVFFQIIDETLDHDYKKGLLKIKNQLGNRESNEDRMKKFIDARKKDRKVRPYRPISIKTGEEIHLYYPGQRKKCDVISS